MKRIVELTMLHLFSQQDYYGYALLQKIYPLFPKAQESALYTILRGLYKESLISSYQGEKSDGPPRKYYTITEAGREYLKELTSEWQNLIQEMKKLGIE